MKTLVLGGSAYDSIIQIGALDELRGDMSFFAEDSFMMLGSTGAGKAMALHSLEVPTTLITCVGDDDVAPIIKNELAKLNIDVMYLLRDKSITHTNIMHSKGKRLTIATSYPSVLPEFDETELRKHIEEADVIFLNINDFCKAFIPIVKEYDKLIIVDLHDYDNKNPYHQVFVDAGDILITSGVQIEDHVAYMSQHIDSGKKISIVTKSNEGLIAMDQSKNIYELPGATIHHFVDSNGAGDAFTVGFGMAYVETDNIVESLRFGTICGGIACSSKKLFNTEITREEINKITKRKEL